MAELAPDELIASLRRPKTIFTQNYLNDPINFDPDERFEPESAIRQLQQLSIVNRDSVGYALADINKRESQWYPITMFRPVLARQDIGRTIDKQFKWLI
jgi:hypothetical protein